MLPMVYTPYITAKWGTGPFLISKMPEVSDTLFICYVNDP